jgi:hypothetical protein
VICFRSGEECEGAMEFATLIAKNDGSRLRGRESPHWYSLAIHGITGPKERYLVSIRFYPHPSKEPFQVAREVGHAVAVALFFVVHDPLVVLDASSSFSGERNDLRRLYDLQSTALLVDFEKAAPSYVCACRRWRPISNRPPQELTLRPF